MGIEIERKFTVKEMPGNLENYSFHKIEQAYLNVRPAVRVRREDDIYYMTYKGSDTTAEGDIGKVEYNMPLDKASYEHLLAKADGNIISKKRYIIPLNEDAFSNDFMSENPQVKRAVDSGDIKIELDVFEGVYDGRILAEVEFPDEATAREYRPAKWFDEDVTGNVRYSNSHMSLEKL